MRVIGFNLSKILVERKDSFEGRLEVKQNINIQEVLKDKINLSKGEEEVLKLKFNFLIEYGSDFAKLDLGGQLIISVDKDEMKRFLKSWKTKEIPENLRTPLFNFIMSKCNIKALELEDDLSLPYHVPMPRINPNQP